MRSGSRTTGTGLRTTGTGPRTTGTGARAEVFRLVPPLIFWWVWVAFVVANVIDFAVQGAQARFVTVVLAILAAGTGLAYALALRPRVLADQAGITVLNPFRTHHLPWPAVRSVDVAEWVRVHCDQDQTIGCWALVATARERRQAGRPGMFSRLRQSAPAAGVSRLPEEARRLASLSSSQAIATRLDALARKARASADGAGQARGSAAAAAADGDAVTSRWSWPAIAAVVIPAVALLIVGAA